MKILVTGSTGFIGSRLSLMLAEKGYTVHALCRNKNSSLIPLHNNIHLFEGDILNKESLLNAMKDCRQVYHTAALAKMWSKNKNDFYNVNVNGTKNVLHTAMKCGIEKLVHTSTCGVLGPALKYPVTENDPRITGFPIDYERTKFLAELEVKSFIENGMNAVIVNPSRVYGEGPVTDSNTVSKIICAYLKGRWRINPANGKQVSNYAYIDDVVRGHIGAMEKGIAGERYILGGEDISFDTFFKTLESVSGIHYKLFNVSQKAIKLYSYMELFRSTVTGLPPFFLPEFADRLRYDQKYCSNKAAQKLGYSITSFTEGLFPAK